MANIYALYKGERNIMDGTIKQIAEYMKVKPKTVRFLASKRYSQRRKEDGNSCIVVLIGKE